MKINRRTLFAALVGAPAVAQAKPLTGTYFETQLSFRMNAGNCAVLDVFRKAAERHQERVAALMAASFRGDPLPPAVCYDEDDYED